MPIVLKIMQSYSPFKHKITRYCRQECFFHSFYSSASLTDPFTLSIEQDSKSAKK
ncbi:hypothetical protein CANTEDRAFT_112245 [Yamadazyma tenuis ATCC 10573]|uniref:Uncharacterized protein n=1 Tax=Candida tenuis (strain ATCC 10573 / BCRC 21748 / CBS 615 / JCM 9827 / NBRC 10315 / NRRL Y-1498 / VKM Y-70) TaxID=590646 RepID=G3AWE9_CANTC|nr:uncharacterized protein CANTEDRAFT_112245 [Yamadazyma tenuis ATCC 10573]EGV66526.1 hypothetical protein CANTEDRAFT_112245 [Yamadazyma tenuis ATCC 10573]